MDVRKLDVMPNQESFDGLLGRLLSVKAQVFEVDPLRFRAGKRQIAPGSADPFARVFQCVRVRNGTPPDPGVRPER